MRRCRGNTKATGSGSDRAAAANRLDERTPPSKSELGVSVKLHLALLLAVVFARRTASKEGRTFLSAVHNLCGQLS